MNVSHTDAILIDGTSQKTAEVETRRKPASLAWVWIVLVLGLVAAGCFWLYRYTETATQPPGGRGGAASRALPVLGAAAVRGDLPVYLTGLGTVTPFYTVNVKARVDGQIDKVLFKEGQIVHEGDQLFQIDPRPYQVILDEVQGQLEKDQATYNNSKVNVDRDRQAGNAVSRQQIDTDTTAMDQAAGAMTIDKAQIASANLNLAYCKITAPITGRIGLRIVDQGNMVHASDSSGLAIITQLQPIAVVFTLVEDEIQQVQKRMSAGGTIQVEAYSRDLKSKLATGSLIAIDNQIDSSSGTVKLKAAFENADNSLFPNQFVNVKLLVDTIKDTVLVPAAAIQRSPTSTFVWVGKLTEPAAERISSSTTPAPEYAVSRKDISVGITEAAGISNIDMTAITSGLAVGEIVITDSVDKLQDGSKVTVRLGNRAATSGPASASSASRQHS